MESARAENRVVQTGDRGQSLPKSVQETVTHAGRPAPFLLWLQASPHILTISAPIFYSRTNGLLLLYPMPHLRCPSSSLVNTGC